MNTAQDVLRIAASQIGITENPPGSNHNPYSTADLRPEESWCADFCVWVLHQAGTPVPVNTPNAAALVNSFQHNLTPLPGDLVGYHFAGEAAGIDHVGIVESYDLVHDLITSIEGNTTSDDAGVQSNGGGVYRRVRPRSQAVLFGRPSYSPPVTEVVKPMYSPPLGPIVAAWLDAQGHVISAVDAQGHVFWGKWYGNTAGKPYWGSRVAAGIGARPDGQPGYRITATDGATYDLPDGLDKI